MVRSVAYSMLYVRTKDDADADTIRSTMMENIDPRKWICVQAEKQVALKFGNDVFFIMGDVDTVDAIVAQATKLATDKGLKVSEAVEKVNTF